MNPITPATVQTGDRCLPQACATAQVAPYITTRPYCPCSR